MQLGGIILCGGKSTRMGLSKAMLPLGNETMLARVVRLLSAVAEPIVVVAASGQNLPPLHSSVKVVRDEHPDQGPLQGLRDGLRAMQKFHTADAVYATSCDVPLLAQAFVQAMAAELGDHDIAVPAEGKMHHPLAAIYRVGTLDLMESLLAAGHRRPADLYNQCRTHKIPVEQLRVVDPQLHTLANCNHPQDYLEALRTAKLPLDAEISAALELSSDS